MTHCTQGYFLLVDMVDMVDMVVMVCVVVLVDMVVLVDLNRTDIYILSSLGCIVCTSNNSGYILMKTKVDSIS